MIRCLNCTQVVGSPSSLGAWDVKAALPLEWSTGDVWQGELRLPAGLYEFKVSNWAAELPTR